MADAFTDFILKPAPHFAAGVVLFGVVWGFFKGVESVLTDDTKLEIAVWLLGVQVGQKVEPWPETFATVFDRVFGKKHLSWKCFSRSALATLTTVLLTTGTSYFIFVHGPLGLLVPYLAVLIAVAIGPDYASLLVTRKLMSLAQTHPGNPARVAILIAALSVGCVVAVVVIRLDVYVYHLVGFKSDLGGNNSLFANVALEIYLIAFGAGIASLFASIWLWLYAGSGFILKAARRFDIGFHWFNRKFDIEKKPLQSIGLVAGALVALVYWAAVIVSKVA
jgi:hypothetical protein